MIYVDVAVAKSFTGGKVYSYAASEKIKIGVIVKIPFGKNIAWGVVVGIVKKPTFAVKEVNHISAYVLPTATLKMIDWMVSFYPDDAGQIVQLFLPKSLAKKPSAAKNIISQGKG